MTSLIDISKLTEDNARSLLEKIRWPNGPTCAHCGSGNVYRLQGNSTRPGLLKCRDCRKQFSVQVGTIFERSHIPLNKWVIAFHLMCSSKKGISALQLKRNLNLSYQSAWHMAHRIRHAMKNEPLKSMLGGVVEVDETYVGGKGRHKGTGRGTLTKTPVVALIARKGGMRAMAIERLTAEKLKGAIKGNVHKNSTIMTDEWHSYKGIGKEFDGGHETVKHSIKQYVRGRGKGKPKAHVNSAESWFALLKRGVHGTFHHVSKQHLNRYCDEFAFRWTHRKTTDGERTLAALSGAKGKRLSYKLPRAVGG